MVTYVAKKPSEKKKKREKMFQACKDSIYNSKQNKFISFLYALTFARLALFRKATLNM